MNHLNGPYGFLWLANPLQKKVHDAAYLQMIHEDGRTAYIDQQVESLYRDILKGLFLGQGEISRQVEWANNPASAAKDIAASLRVFFPTLPIRIQANTTVSIDLAKFLNQLENPTVPLANTAGR